MNKLRFIPAWTVVAPVAAWLILAAGLMGVGRVPPLLLTAGLIGSVLAAVHHAEVVAHRVGEPFGTLLLALAVTVIEVAYFLAICQTSKSSNLFTDAIKLVLGIVC